jgi:hypothetical protein
MKYYSIIAILVLCLLQGCGKIVVIGRSNGEIGNDNIEIVKLSVTRGNLQAANTRRLYSFNGAVQGSDHRLPAAQLKVEITGNPDNLNESYNYIQFVSAQGAFDGGTSVDKTFIENNFGKIFYLTAPQQNANRESSTNNTSHFGSGHLFIIQDNDRFVPWSVSSGSNRCLAMGGGTDCFDMRTFTRQIFTKLVNSVQPSVEALVTNPHVTRQQLLYIPHVVHSGFEGEGRRARGFGLVYFAEIDILTGKAFVFIPMKFLFLDNINGYTFFIDPIDNTSFSPGPSVSRSIYVRGEFITGALEGIIRDNINTAIGQINPQQLIPGIENGELIMAAFNAASGQSGQEAASFRTNPIYDFILIPDDGVNGLRNTVLWEKINNDAIENKEKVKLVFLE